MRTKKPNQHRLTNTRWLFIVSFLGLTLIIALLELTNVTHLLHRTTGVSLIPTTDTNTPSTVTPKPSSNNDTRPTNDSPTNSSQPVQAKSPDAAAPSSGQGTEFIAPRGSFVSNHSPGKNGSPTAEQSVCTTTPGASCYIQFVKDGVVKKLDAKIVDGSGSVVWSWDVKDAGFAAGAWQITAVSSLSGQTKSTIDSIVMEIGS